ncbi:MAG: cyclase family protein [Acidimicrobiia bacterium]|nr:cyclase family protein [Acidimicrobiia bacterium]
MRIVDLTVELSGETYSPPSVNQPLGITVFTKEPGWQATKVDLMLHSGSHIDFSKHYRLDGETAENIGLDRVSGEAVVVDLSDIEPNTAITVEMLRARSPEFRPGDLILVRTGWTDRAWGEFPRYYIESPWCEPSAADWLVSHRPKAVGFDCFSEQAARWADYQPADFHVHRIVGDAGAILMQQLTGLGQLPVGERFQFFAPFLAVRGAEGAPARFFAVLE